MNPKQLVVAAVAIALTTVPSLAKEGASNNTAHKQRFLEA